MGKVRRDAKGRVLRKGESFRKSQDLYTYSYTDPFGKRKFIYEKELTDLRKREEELVKDQLDGLDIYIRGMADLNFAFDRYISTKRNLRKTTKSNYIYAFDRYVRPGFGKKLIAKIKYSDVLCFYEALLDERSLSISTVDNLNTVLYPTFEMAIRDDIIRKNPTKDVMKELRRDHSGETVKRIALTLTQQRAFVEWLGRPENIRWRPLFVTLLGTGGRIGEITGLRWRDVDFSDKTISINHTLSYFADRTDIGKHTFMISKPKTASGVRVIPMLDAVEDALREEAKFQKMSGIKCTSVVDGYRDFVFCNRFGELLRPNGTNKVLRRIISDYNVSEEILAKKEKRAPELIPMISNHNLRHTFCTRLCERESNIKVIQYVMGHADIRTTMNIYADVTKETAKESFKKFSDGVDLF